VKKYLAAYNSTYPKGGVSGSKVSFVVNRTLVFKIKFCGKSPALRVAANRSPFTKVQRIKNENK
jgi:hypothetical protein